MATPTGARTTTILVIDDQAFYTTMLRNTLEQQGYQVLTAGSGAEGLALARTHRPNAVLLDIEMPKMDGFEVCAEMKKDPALRAIPVIILTSTNDPKLNEKAFKAGAEITAAKTVAGDRLINILRLALTKSAPPAP